MYFALAGDYYAGNGGGFVYGCLCINSHYAIEERWLGCREIHLCRWISWPMCLAELLIYQVRQSRKICMLPILRFQIGAFGGSWLSVIRNICLGDLQTILSRIIRWNVSQHCIITSERPITTFIWYLQSASFWIIQSRRLPAEICFMTRKVSIGVPRRKSWIKPGTSVRCARLSGREKCMSKIFLPRKMSYLRLMDFWTRWNVYTRMWLMSVP